jgi:hypothetical protein
MRGAKVAISGTSAGDKSRQPCLYCLGLKVDVAYAGGFIETSTVACTRLISCA